MDHWETRRRCESVRWWLSEVEKQKNSPARNSYGISWNKPSWQDHRTGLHCTETIFGRFYLLIWFVKQGRLRVYVPWDVKIWKFGLFSGKINMAKLEFVSRNWNPFPGHLKIWLCKGRIPTELLSCFIFASLSFDQLLLFYFFTFVAVIVAKLCFFGKAPGLQGPYCTVLSFRKK